MYLKNSKTIVIKIGSSLLIDEKNTIRQKWLSEFIKDIKELLNQNKNVIIVAHGNSLRAIMINIGLYKPEEISNIELPTGKPFCIVYEKNKI